MLSVDGAVNKPLKMSIDELKQRLKRSASNSRSSAAAMAEPGSIRRAPEINGPTALLGTPSGLAFGWPTF